MSKLNEAIEEFALSENIAFGICAADNLDNIEGDISNIPFFKGNTLERISPGRFLPGAKSLIVLAVAVERTAAFEGLDLIMAPSLCGIDYHKRLRLIADELISKLLEIKNFSYKIHIDSGPLLERAFALKAGLGVIGKNNCLINSRFGSFFNLALIVSDLELIKNTAKSTDLLCINCHNCINSCPTKALSTDGSFDYKKCISYLTQKKGKLNEWEQKMIGTTIYGCDICQSVCPKNTPFNLPERKKSKEVVLRQILEMSKERFSLEFKESSFFWRGPSVIKRNCRIALNNMERGV